MTIIRGSGNPLLITTLRNTVVICFFMQLILKHQDTPLLNISDPFLSKTVEYWSTLNYREDNLNFPFSQIWLNSIAIIDDKPFFYKSRHGFKQDWKMLRIYLKIQIIISSKVHCFHYQVQYKDELSRVV